MLLTFQACNNLVCLLRHLLIDVLALLVVFVDVLRHVESRGEVFLNEQVNRLLAILHAARCIDARSYFEHDVAHGEFAPAKSADVDNGFQARARILVQLLQSVEGQDAVLVGDGNNICSDAHGTEVQQWDEPRERNTIVLGECLHELKAYTTATKVLEGVGIVGTLGVQNGCGIGHRLIWHMVVADDEVDTQALCIGYFVDSLDATVENNNQSHAGVACILQSLSAHAVAFVVAVGDVVIDV